MHIYTYPHTETHLHICHESYNKTTWEKKVLAGKRGTHVVQIADIIDQMCVVNRGCSKNDSDLLLCMLTTPMLDYSRNSVPYKSISWLYFALGY